MKLAAIACLGVLLSGAQAQTTQIQPTPLESFAKQTGSHVAWSSETGRIDSRDGHAIITAIVVEDTAQPPDRLRGVRIDLSDRNATDQVYLGEETLAAFRNALDEIQRFGTHHDCSTTAQPCPDTAYMGAELFWYGDKKPAVHTLTAAHYFRPDSTGLVLSPIGAPSFFFPDQKASQLSAAIARAMELLKGR